MARMIDADAAKIRFANYREDCINEDDINAANVFADVVSELDEFLTIDPVTAAAEALGMSPDRLRDLAQAEKEGRLVVMPFSVAKHIYRIVDMKSHSAYNDFVTCERVLPFGIPIESILGGARIIPIEQFGKTVFLTREAAEAALEEREAEHDR